MPGDIVIDSQDHAAFLDEHNCARYQLSDVVMPLVGSKVLYGLGRVPKMLEEFLNDELAIDGISLQSFQDCGK